MVRRGIVGSARVAVCLMLLAGRAWAQDAKHPTFTDPAKAGPEYAMQGEYVGEGRVDDKPMKLGAHIIALGDGKLRLVGYHGGLPGDGWRRADESVTAEGELGRDGVAVFHDDEWSARCSDGVLKAFADGSDQAIAELKKVVRKSPTLGVQPPAGAIVLFDGTTAEKFAHGKLVEDNLLLADCESLNKFGDHSLHLEFRTPFKPHAREQERGNSGVYIQSRYEVQVLDSFGLSGEDNECGGIYSIQKPAVNMCFPPLTWQTYDYDFTAARYDADGNKTQNARVTLKHNGVVIHDQLELTHGTPGRAPEGPGDASLYLQGHGNPVVYRNIWAIKR